MNAIYSSLASRSAIFNWLIIFVISQTIARAEVGVTTSNNIYFSGYNWKIKASEKRVGPGSNFFSDSKDNVWVDGEGHLHLKIRQNEGNWYCAEVISTNNFGFGTYCFHVSTPLSDLDPRITLGLFTWSDALAYAHREIDIECGKWGNVSDTNNAQFVVQPYQRRGRLVRYQVPENIQEIAYSFLWRSNSVLFTCISEKTTISPERVIYEWRFDGDRVPQPGNENARVNLWLSSGRFPLNSNRTEIVIKKFEFIPLNAGAGTGH